MKKQFIILLACAALLACNNATDKKEAVSTEKTESDNSSASSSTPDNSSTASLDYGQKRMEELKKMPPVSNETLKALFPTEVMGMKRSSFNVSSAMGYAVGTAEYRKDDNTNYSVSLYDCAGEAGSAFYGMSYLSRLNMEREDDNGYEKTVSYMGTNAIEAYDKSSNEHRLHFLGGDRFWVSVEGNEGLDKLKEFVNALGLDKLKSVK
jgi:hypothetical protein